MAYQAAQKEKDKQIQLVLEKICSELKRLHSITTEQARSESGPTCQGQGRGSNRICLEMQT
jgi:hypothetical protein